MDLYFGVKQCHDILVILSSQEAFETRLRTAVLKIAAIQRSNVSNLYYKRIRHWHNDYKTGNLNWNKIDQSKSVHELVWLCIKTIRFNTSKILSKTD